MRHHARLAVLWSAADMFMRQGVGFIISIVLARLLVPEDFGTLALLGLFLGLAGLFVNAGFSQALIQRQDVSHVDESTVFWFNTIVALLMMLLLFSLAPWLAVYFDLPVLSDVTKVLALNIPLSALGGIHATLMAKRLDFKTPMKIGVSSTIFSGGIAVYMAWAGHGVWALVGQAVTGSILGTLLLWYYSPWRPLFHFSIASITRLLSFGGWLSLGALLDVVFTRGYTLVIGKFYSPYDLGIYNRADSTQQLPGNLLSGILSKVTFPLYSAVNHDKAKLKRGVKLSIRTMMFVSAPIMMGLAVVAEPFLRVVFGKQWVPAAPILQILCVAGMFLPIHIINLDVLQAQGHGREFFLLDVYKKIAGIAFIVAGTFFGLIGIALGRVASSIISLYINCYFTDKHLQYGIMKQLSDCADSIVFAFLMAGLIYALDPFTGFEDIAFLLAALLLGSSIYIALHVLFKTAVHIDVLSILRNRIEK